MLLNSVVSVNLLSFNLTNLELGIFEFSEQMYPN